MLPLCLVSYWLRNAAGKQFKIVCCISAINADLNIAAAELNIIDMYEN